VYDIYDVCTACPTSPPCFSEKNLGSNTRKGRRSPQREPWRLTSHNLKEPNYAIGFSQARCTTGRLPTLLELYINCCVQLRHCISPSINRFNLWSLYDKFCITNLSSSPREVRIQAQPYDSVATVLALAGIFASRLNLFILGRFVR
jgi:hypothetical protein